MPTSPEEVPPLQTARDTVSTTAPSADVLSSTDTEELLMLISTGQLFALQQWLREGRPIPTMTGTRRAPLERALKAGFHSVVEVLLRHTPSIAACNRVLRWGVEARRPDLVDLALGLGADVRSTAFEAALRTYQIPTSQLFVRYGADPIADNAFARVLSRCQRVTVGMYFTCRRQRPDLADALQAQADIALRMASFEGRARAVALLLYLGANPRTPGPSDDSTEAAQDRWTAVEAAANGGHLALLKRYAPTPQHDDIAKLLTLAARSTKASVVRHLLQCGATTPLQGSIGSVALDHCLQGYWRARVPTLNVTATGVAACVRALVEHGATWTPNGRAIRDLRSILVDLPPSATIELVAILRANHACADSTIERLLRAPTMVAHLGSSSRELHAIGMGRLGRPLLPR